MTTPTITLASSYIREIASFLEPRHVEPWIRKSGFALTDLDDATVTVPMSTFSDMLLQAADLANEPAIGLFLGERLIARTHGFVGYAALNSSTLRELLRVLESFVPLRFSILRVFGRVSGEDVRFVVESELPLGRVERPVSEAIVMSLRNVLSAVSLGSFDVRAFAFPFDEPAYGSLVRDVAGTTVLYDQGWTGLLLRASDLDVPLRTADPAVFEDAARICRQRMEELEAGKRHSDRVRRMLFSSENGFPSLQACAHRLHMTPRTLHRRLVAEGTSFRKVLDDVRFRLAEDYIVSGRASLDEIAFMLGYSDPANFRRAFRRWAGVPPSVFRDRIEAS